VTASGIAMTIGGASILLGIKPKLGAVPVVGFLLAVSPLMHDFWRVEDPNQRVNELVNFSKNLALLGAALALMAVKEPWPLSVPVAQPRATERVKRIGRRIAA
jgi:putative oxidoreductase